MNMGNQHYRYTADTNCKAFFSAHSGNVPLESLKLALCNSHLVTNVELRLILTAVPHIRRINAVKFNKHIHLLIGDACILFCARIGVNTELLRVLLPEFFKESLRGTGKEQRVHHRALFVFERTVVFFLNLYRYECLVSCFGKCRPELWCSVVEHPQCIPVCLPLPSRAKLILWLNYLTI